MAELPGDATAAFERLLAEEAAARYLLRLYVAGMTGRSFDAIERAREMCETYLPGRYELEVIDIHQRPELARIDQIVAVPTLVRSQPLPIRRLVGDLSNRERVIHGLELHTKGD